ncbi:MAG TPA: caspase family protein [Hyphomicrobium sp.]|nr:caspase family protein [Hyphomicrobium sp.]
MQASAMRLSVLAAALLGLVIAVPAEAAGRRLALVIGNSAYQHVAELTNPQNDASDVAEKLRSLSFDVMLGTNLTRDQMHEAFEKFAQELKPGDEGLFFYAGHGISLSGENFLIPVDMPAEIQVQDEAQSKDALDKNLVNISSVIEPMQKAKLGMIFLDACRNTPSREELGLQIVAQDGATRKLRSLSFSRGMTKVSVPSTSGASGIFRAYATQPNNVSDDGGGRNSPFTKALLKHMGTKGVDVHQMMIKVRLDVQTETNGRQVPWEESALTDVYYFTPSAPGMAAPLLPTYRDDAPASKRSKATTAQSPRKNKGAGGAPRQARRNSPPPGLGAGVGAGL